AASVFEAIETIHRSGKRWPRKVLLYVLEIVTVLFIGNNFLRAVGLKEITTADKEMTIAIIVFNFLCLLLLISAVSHAVRGSKSPHPELGKPLYIVALITVVLGALLGNSRFAFPNLDQSFGGGRPHHVEFVVKADKIPAIQQFGFEPKKEKL